MVAGRSPAFAIFFWRAASARELDDARLRAVSSASPPSFFNVMLNDRRGLALALLHRATASRRAAAVRACGSSVGGLVLDPQKTSLQVGD